MFAIEGLEQFESFAVSLGRDEAVRVGFEVGDRVAEPGSNDGALVASRQEGGVPVLGTIGGEPTVIGQHDKAGQVFGLGTQCVADPGPCPGEPGSLEAGGLQQSGLAVDSGLAHHRMDEGQFIGAAAQCSDGVAEHLAAFAVGPEREGRSHPGPQPVLKRLDRLAEVRLLPVVLFEGRLVVEEVDVAGRTGHEQLDHSLGTRPVVQSTGQDAAFCGGGGRLAIEQVGQRDAAQATSGLPEKVPARAGVGRGAWAAVVGGGGHSTKTNSLRFRMTRQELGRPCRVA